MGLHVAICGYTWWGCLTERASPLACPISIDAAKTIFTASDGNMTHHRPTFCFAESDVMSPSFSSPTPNPNRSNR